jgi:hypothetical protein
VIRNCDIVPRQQSLQGGGNRRIPDPGQA